MDESKRHIEELREFYKNKNSQPKSLFNNFLNKNVKEESNNSKANFKSENITKEISDNSQKTNNSMFKNLFNSNSNFPKYALTTFIFIISFYIFVLIIDSLVIENIVHSKEIMPVPNLIGKNISEAQAILNQNNLKFEVVKKQFDVNLEKGTVLRQKPKPDRLIKEDRIVYLTISEGIEEITVPKLANLSKRQARVELINSGLSLGNINEIHSDNIEAGMVISQSPVEGTKLKYNDRVNIVISKGSENQIVLPDLSSLTLEEATQKLLSLGLNVGTVTTIENETFQDGIVVGQFPTAEKVVNKGSFVDLEVVKN